MAIIVLGDKMIRLNVDYLLKKNNKSIYWLVKNMNSTYPNIKPLVYSRVASIKLNTIDKLCELFDCEPGDLIIREKQENNENDL